jgi:hypothetical protein
MAQWVSPKEDRSKIGQRATLAGFKNEKGWVA